MNKKFLISAFTLIGVTHDSFAQSTPPDAGQIQRDTSKPALTPPKKSDIKIVPKVQEAKAPALPADGTEVLIKSVKFTGNTVFTEEELAAKISDSMDKKQTLKDMRTLATRVNDFYREEGYYFSRVVVPPQTFSDGVLTLAIEEGRYGDIKLEGTEAIVKGSTGFLSALQKGNVIDVNKLESALLTFDDVPGVSVLPLITEGTDVGTADLIVTAKIDKVTGGELGVDNSGSRYTGQNRAKLNWYRNTTFTFGDNIDLNAILTDEALWLGSLDYDAPLNGRGLRGQLGYAYTSYDLAKDYASLGATGFAQVWSAKVGYGLVRTQRTNLHLAVGYQHKDLNDKYATAGIEQNKSSNSFPVLLHFDHRDKFMSGGVTYGLLSWTPGTLNLDDGLLINDQVTARSDGYFNKYNFDLVRIQSLPGNFSLYLRYSLQAANKNLDSSERMRLGGSDGVRAYPMGEGSGDTGWLGQAELRYDLNEYAPYIFYDGGSTDLNHTPWDTASDKTRTIGGAGLGVRYNYEDQKWIANLAVAWRTDGGLPQNDVGNGAYRVLFSASRLF